MTPPATGPARFRADLLAGRLRRQPGLPSARRSHRNCGRHVLVAQYEDRLQYWALPCHSWACPSCARALKAKWLRTIEACNFEPTVFLTLTWDPAKLEARCPCTRCRQRTGERPATCLLLDVAAQQRLARIQIHALMRRARRRWGPIQYFRVTEFHSGRWDPKRELANRRTHYHLLLTGARGGGYHPRARHSDRSLRRYDARRDWFQQAVPNLAFGLTRAYDIPPTTKAAVLYCAKYLTKASADARWRIRMVACSRTIRHPRTQHEPPLESALVLQDAHGPSVLDEIDTRAARLVNNHAMDPCSPLGTRLGLSEWMPSLHRYRLGPRPRWQTRHDNLLPFARNGQPNRPELPDLAGSHPRNLRHRHLGRCPAVCATFPIQKPISNPEPITERQQWDPF